ncbi:formate dehydrogenase accessory sulfurtransferase FdhD [Raineyella fluvialis]|uniref:Sulfur carrier protein FdhD n=1 Tax=Raineyella fluvialis TaxID=2662261 RepID=A0A5Q2F7C1_9ACTN|nr:formate dehydrogenase accessory sulfurtransferase FdhD [Raineyella fluvialis]QGF22890.1 formate dehydrogenase accessory sulfurtransferase FdhD [Raineyella fluvialis]
MGRVTQRRRITTIEPGGTTRTRIDSLVVEEPLEIRLNGEPWAVTMRTPGHDIELVHGFLLSEGIITSAEDIRTARYCEGSVMSDETGTDVNTYNVLSLALAPGVAMPEPRRSTVATSSCGVCGQASIDTIRTRSPWPLPADRTPVDPALLAVLPERLRQAQRQFAATGGLHASGIFSTDGELLVAREDVGRHNAADKAIGWAMLRDRLPLHDAVLVLSGRTSFELIQKAMVAGIPTVVAISAPSSLAVELAEDAGMTLTGFVREGRMNVYSGAEHLH